MDTRIEQGRLSGLLASTAVAVAVLDDDGRVVESSPGLADLLGRPREEIVGLTAGDLARPGVDLVTAPLHDGTGSVVGSLAVLQRSLPVERPGGNETAGGDSSYLETAFAASADGLAVVDLASRMMLAVNDAGCRLFGYDREELVGRNVAFLHPSQESFDEFGRRAREIVASGSPGEVGAWPMKRRDGTPWLAEFTVSAVPSRDDRLYVTVFRDVTEREETAKAIAESEARYRTLVEHSSEAIVVLDLEAGTMAQVNTRAEKLFGMSRERLLKAHPVELSPPVQPDGRTSAEAAADYIRQAIEGGTPSFEWTHVDTSGETIPCEVRLVSLPSSDRTLIRGTVIDLRGRIEARQALDRARRMLQNAASIGRMGGWSFHPDTRRMTLSEEAWRIVGRPPGGELEFEEVVALLHPDDQDALRAAARRAGDLGQPYEIEYRIVRPGGEVRWLSSRAEPIRDAAGKAVEWVGVSQDVTERRRLEDELRQSQKLEAVGQLAGGIAHEFNNLLTAITGYADLLVTSLDPEDERRSDAVAIVEAADRAARLTRQLLTFSRREPLRLELLDVNDVIGATARLIEQLIGAAIALEVHLAPALPPVRADRLGVEQVLLNLAVNARDAMVRGGELRIETALEQRDGRPAVRLSVADTGTGIAPGVQERIFEPFFTTKGPGEGTGLGLSTVFGIVEQSGGAITVESTPGHGASFHVWLPAASDEGDASGAVGRALAPPRCLILLVEDEPAVRELARRVLEGDGYTVVTAADGEQALTSFDTDGDRIGLVITDVVMPRLGGRELVSRLRARKPDLPVIYMSGYAEPVPEGDDAAFLLHKPFTSADLLARTREALGVTT